MITAKKLTVLAFVVGFLALLVGLQVSKFLRQDAIPGFLWPEPKSLSAFALQDHYRQPFDLDRLKGKWTFLFFGYTNCPDVCPTTLSVLASVEKQLKEAPQGLKDTQFVFVSVDPQRDTPEHLAKYLAYFNKDFLGVSGPSQRLRDLTRQLGVYIVRPQPHARGSYLIEHSASILLTDPKARLVGIFGLPHDSAEIAHRFRRMRAFLEG